jgi:hypothetical protein
MVNLDGIFFLLRGRRLCARKRHRTFCWCSLIGIHLRQVDPRQIRISNGRGPAARQAQSSRRHRDDA